MKKLIFLIPFIVILVTLYLSTDFYLRDSTDKLTELLPTEDQKVVNTASSDQDVKEIANRPVDLKSADESDTSVHHEGTKLSQEKDEESNVELADKDAPNDGPAKEKINSELEAIQRETRKDDQEIVDPDDLHSAEYLQLLERFGDIPEVHSYMKYMRNAPLTINEEIAGLEAVNSLFPSGSTRRTLALLKWMKSNGGYNAFEQGIPIDELRNLGITVEIDETNEGWGYFITTK